MSGRGAWIQADRQERLDRQAAACRARRGRFPMAAARTVIRHRFPEFIIEKGPVRGYDLFALEAVLCLWERHGEGNVTGQMLRACRQELVDQRREAA